MNEQLVSGSRTTLQGASGCSTWCSGLISNTWTRARRTGHCHLCPLHTRAPLTASVVAVAVSVPSTLSNSAGLYRRRRSSYRFSSCNGRAARYALSVRVAHAAAWVNRQACMGRTARLLLTEPKKMQKHLDALSSCTNGETCGKRTTSRLKQATGSWACCTAKQSAAGGRERGCDPSPRAAPAVVYAMLHV